MTEEAMKAASRISARSGIAVQEVIDRFRDAVKKGISVESFIFAGQCYNIALPGVVGVYDADIDVPGRFIGSQCYNIGSSGFSAGAHTGSKGVGRARVNGRSMRKAVR